jgi:hypothetical protein
MEERKTLRDLMEGIASLGTERRFARLMLGDDPFFGRLPPDREAEAIDFALAAGQRATDETAALYGRDPEAVASSLKVPVKRSDEPSLKGKAILFSEYADRPPAITLYSQPMDEANRLLRENDLIGLLGIDDLVPVYLAHELYHHLDAKRLTPGTAGFRVTTLRLGPLRLGTGLPSLCEIAADRFALSLLGLKVPPKALHFVTIHAHNPDFAWQLLERLQGFPV